MRRAPVAAVLAALALALGLAGCGDDHTSGAHRSMDPPPGRAADGPMGGDHGASHDEHHDHAESTPVADGARRIEVGATSFAFDPAEITVTAGEDIAIALSSDDVLHDFAIDGVDVHVAADRGETAEGGLRIDEPGRYRFFCTIAGHREAGMEGTLVVEEP